MNGVLWAPEDGKFSYLITRSLGDEQWQLMRDFEYEHPSGTIRVPHGFIFDFDSVPRIPVVYAWLKGRAHKSAVIHDWLYAMQSVSRKEADRIFLDAMYDEGVPWYRALPIYLAVRLFGGRPYRRYTVARITLEDL